MLLLRLKLINFLIYDEVDVDLSEIRLASIIGQFVNDRRRSNGSGKTAFLEAIRYALFDQTRSKKKSGVLKIGKKKSIVELDFKIDDRKVKVTRELDEAGLSSARLYIDGKLSGDKVRVVNDSIASLIGLDAELFEQIYFFKQGDHFGFAEAQPTERKNALAKVFRMELLTRCEENARKLRSSKESAQTALKGALDLLGSELNSLRPYQSLVDEEMAITANLASAQQLAHFLKEMEQCNASSAASLRQNHALFTEETSGDVERHAMLIKQRDEISRAIARQSYNRSEAEARVAKAKSEVRAEAATDTSELLAKKKTAETVLEDLRKRYQAASNLHYMLEENLKKAKSTKLAFKAGDKCPTCSQAVAGDHLEHIAQAQLEAVRSFEEQIVTAKNTLDDLAVKKRESDKIVDDLGHAINTAQYAALTLRNLRDAEAALNNLKDDPTLPEKLTAIEKEISDIAKRIDPKLVQEYLAAVEKKLVKSRYLFVGHQNRLNSVLATIDAKNRDLIVCQQNIQRRRELEERLEKKKSEWNVVARENLVYSYLVEAFGKNGIQALIVENAIGLIESFANNVLKQMQTRFSISIRTTKETKAGDVKESLDIFVFDNGSEKQFESYSGGEKSLINIAIRLALSKVVSSLHGVKMQSLFLDEVLGSLDAPNREEVVKILSYLSREYQQVFVVSHTDEVQDVIDSSIIIERSPTNSTVRIKNG